MQASHAPTAIDIAFDEPNLIVDAGVVPVMALVLQRHFVMYRTRSGW